MNALFGFGQSADVTIKLDDYETRPTARIRTEEGNFETHYLYLDGETVAGTVEVRLKKSGQKLEHHGIRIEFIGQIEVYYDRGNQHDFISLTRDLARAGELTDTVTPFRFEFANPEKPYESYMGQNVKLRYFLRVTIIRRLSDIVKEMDVIVHTLSSYREEPHQSIKMEVGIEDCLHIEFEYNKSKYHLSDVIVGKIYFLLVRIKIKYMELTIIKKESVGAGANCFNETETVGRFEIMDGAPVRGESIPIRLFLGGYDLTPTMRDVSKKFSVKYLLNLVLIDEEDRRYFKQQEVQLWRKADRPVRLTNTTVPRPNAAAFASATVPAAVGATERKEEDEEVVEASKQAASAPAPAPTVDKVAADLESTTLTAPSTPEQERKEREGGEKREREREREESERVNGQAYGNGDA